MNRDVVAERQILAMVLSGHPSVREPFLALPHDAFADEMNNTIATVLRDRLRRGIPIDASVVAADAGAVSGTDDQASRVHRFVMDCAASSPPLESWSYYADQVATFTTLRRAVETGTRLLQSMDMEAPDQEKVSYALRVAQEDLVAASDNLAAPMVEPPLSLADLLDTPDEPHDWLIPGLWERMDRVIITGYEGSGKSMLLAQFALSVAAGIHPFKAEPFSRDGFRVLVVDCENSKRQIKRRYRHIRRTVDFIREQHSFRPIDWTQQLRFVMRPEGIDLANVSEFARLEKAIAATAPDLVVVGPLYRLHKMNINDEQAARELVDALDRLRVKYRFTLIAEAHVGHVGESSGGRKLRPTGSSLFLRWPEFGYGIRAFGDAQTEEHPSVVEVVAWRGSRDERHWPELLKHSSDLLPWMPANASYWSHADYVESEAA